MIEHFHPVPGPCPTQPHPTGVHTEPTYQLGWVGVGLGSVPGCHTPHIPLLVFGCGNISPGSLTSVRHHWDSTLHLDILSALTSHAHKPGSQHSVSETLANRPDLNTLHVQNDTLSQSQLLPNAYQYI